MQGGSPNCSAQRRRGKNRLTRRRMAPAHPRSSSLACSVRPTPNCTGFGAVADHACGGQRCSGWGWGRRLASSTSGPRRRRRSSPCTNQTCGPQPPWHCGGDWGGCLRRGLRACVCESSARNLISTSLHYDCITQHTVTPPQLRQPSGAFSSVGTHLLGLGSSRSSFQILTVLSGAMPPDATIISLGWQHTASTGLLCPTLQPTHATPRAPGVSAKR